MEIVCQKCRKKLNVPDNRIPKNRSAYLTCPGCKNRIPVGGTNVPDPEPYEKTRAMTLNELTSSTYDASEKPFDFIEEEARTSLVCVTENEMKDKINVCLSGIDFHNSSADNAREALKKMRYHTFDLVVIDELFDCRSINANGVLIFLQHLPMSIRRHVFVILISGNFRTMDNMQAFNKSVNLIVNRKNMDDFKKILLRGIADNDVFYRVYKRAVKKIVGV